MLPEMADGGDEDALLVFPLHLARRQGGDGADGEAPLLQFLFLGEQLAALDGAEPGFELPAGPLINDGDFRADREAGDNAHEIGHLLVEPDLDGQAVQFQQPVARLQAGLGRRGILLHAADQDAPVGVGTLEQRLHIHADPAALDAAVRDQLPGHSPGEIAGDGAAQAKADFVDADDFAPEIDEGPAGVAAVNRGVMRNPADQRADVLAVQAQLRAGAVEPGHDHLGIADDAEGHGLREGHRAAHGEHGIAHAHRRGIAEGDEIEGAGLFRAGA